MSTTAAEYAKSDSALAASEDFKKAYAKYHEVPSADVIEKAKAGLEKNNHKVTVVANKEEALKTLVSLIPDGVSIHNTSSTTLVRFCPTRAGFSCRLPRCCPLSSNALGSPYIPTSPFTPSAS